MHVNTSITQNMICRLYDVCFDLCEYIAIVSVSDGLC